MPATSPAALPPNASTSMASPPPPRYAKPPCRGDKSKASRPHPSTSPRHHARRPSTFKCVAAYFVKRSGTFGRGGFALSLRRCVSGINRFWLAGPISSTVGIRNEVGMYQRSDRPPSHRLPALSGSEPAKEERHRIIVLLLETVRAVINSTKRARLLWPPYRAVESVNCSQMRVGLAA
jgi:hypothetical protein